MRSDKFFNEMLEEGYRPCPASKCPYGILATCSTCMHAVYPREQREFDPAGRPLYDSMEQNDTKFCTFQKFHIPEDIEELRRVRELESQ